MTSHYRSVVVLLVAAFLIIAGCSQEPETLTTKYDKKRMDRAIVKARSTFDEFLARFRNPLPGDEAFYIKVRIEDENGVEHFWLSDLKLDSEPYSGKIGNEPGVVKKVRLGQTYRFSQSKISDWMYMSNGKMQGNYTLRVALESMPPEKAKTLRQKIGW